MWKWRNAQLFGSRHEILEDKGKFLVDRYDKLLQALDMDINPLDCTSSDRGTEELIRWEPPLQHWVLLNTDGASKGNPGVAAEGGILRGPRGEWICGFSKNFGACTAVKVELKAVLRGLRMARDLGVQKVWLQADSMVIVGVR